MLAPKGLLAASKFYGICPKVKQVVYTLDTISMANIKILAQKVLQIFCSQGSLWVKCPSLKMVIIRSNVHRISWKVNQIIYIMYPNCMPETWFQLKQFFSYFVHKVALLYKKLKLDKGHNSAKYTEFCQKLIRSSTPSTQSVCQISWP